MQAGDFPPPRQVNRAVPPALEAVCLKAMAQEPGNRYPSPKALADEVEHWLADEPVAAWREPLSIRVGRWARRHRTAMAGAAAAVLAGLVGLAAVAAVQTQSNRELQAANEKTSQALRAERLASEKTSRALDAEKLANEKTSRALEAETHAKWELQAANEKISHALRGEKVANEKTTRALEAEKLASGKTSRALDAEKVANEKTTRALEAETHAKREKEQALVQSEAARQRHRGHAGVPYGRRAGRRATPRPELRPGQGRTVRKAIDAAEPKIARIFKDQPIAEAKVRNTSGMTYHYLGELTSAIRQFDEPLTCWRRSSAPTTPKPSSAAATSPWLTPTPAGPPRRSRCTRRRSAARIQARA